MRSVAAGLSLPSGVTLAAPDSGQQDPKVDRFSAALGAPSGRRIDLARPDRPSGKSRMSTPTETDRLLNTSEVAERLGVSVKTVYRIIRDGHLHPANISTDERPIWRISESELRRYVHGRTRRARP